MVPTGEGDYPWAFTTLRDYFPEELAQINLRIHLAARALPARASTLALLSSPAVNDVLDAAYSLINLVDRRASSIPTPPTTTPHTTTTNDTTTTTDPLPPTLPPQPSAINPALDTSTSLIIHASHQAVLGIFDDISSSLLQYLSEPQQQHQQQHRPTPPATPPNAPYFPPCNTQAAVMANLMSHLLGELDRAVLSLVGGEAGAPVRYDGVLEGVNQGGGNGAWGEGVLGVLLREMEVRRVRVGGQVKAVERLLRQPGLDGL